MVTTQDWSKCAPAWLDDIVLTVKSRHPRIGSCMSGLSKQPRKKKLDFGEMPARHHIGSRTRKESKKK